MLYCGILCYGIVLISYVECSVTHTVFCFDIICVLRNSSYGVYIGSVFIGCILHADDIILLAASCHGIQRLVDLCLEYGRTWDIIFNPRKTQCITFGGKQPTLCSVTLDDVNLEWCDKLKYLGCYFKSNTCYSDRNASYYIRNCCGCLNNILSMLPNSGYKRQNRNCCCTSS